MAGLGSGGQRSVVHSLALCTLAFSFYSYALRGWGIGVWSTLV